MLVCIINKTDEKKAVNIFTAAFFFLLYPRKRKQNFNIYMV